MKRTPLNKMGKVGRANLEANKILKEIFAGTGYCELSLEGCMRTWPLQFAHRHKRQWYQGDVKKLSDRQQVIVACQVCHERIENDKGLTEEVFNRLRGDE